MDLAICLNYLIQEKLSTPDIGNSSKEKFYQNLNETLNTKVESFTNVIKDNLLIAQKDRNYKIDFVKVYLLDLTKEASQEKLAECKKAHYLNQNTEYNIYEVSKNITLEDIKTFYEKLFEETKVQEDNLCDNIINNALQEYSKFFESEFEKALKNSIF